MKPLLLFALSIAILAPRPVRAQTDPTAPAPRQECDDPLASLLPECQPGSASPDLTLDSRDSGRGAPLGVDRRALSPVTLRSNSPKPAPGAGSSVTQPAMPAQGPLPARRPTEFQRFAASSTGEILPIFGANLFDNVPTTFAPLDRVPVTADYIVGPGDEVLLRVWGQVNMDLDLTVDRAGSVFVPQAGNIVLAGLQFHQLPSYLDAQLGRVFQNFDLNVGMGQLRSIQIFVVGQVRRPGAYTVSSLSTLVNALFASGGPSAEGSMRRIQLKRGSQVETEFDLYDLLLRGDKSKDARLQPGDVVYVPPVGAQIAVAGSVANPAIYEMKDEKTVGDVIEMAGGLSAVADAGRATLESIKSRSARETLELALGSNGLRTRAGDGDVLRVMAVTPRIENAITLRGNVANPGRFAWREGMRLRDIIPDKESLVTRDYWKKRNLLGFTPPDPATLPLRQTEETRKPKPTGIEPTGPDINWSYAVIERQNARDLSTELVSFNPGRLVLENDDSQNLALRPGDVVTIFSQADVRVSIGQQKRTVKLEGEFAAAGIYSVKPGETLGQLIQRAGGLTPQAYLFGAELLRESAREDQQKRLDQFVRDLQQEVEQTGSDKIGTAATPEESATVQTKLESERRLVDQLRQVKATGRIVLNLNPGDNDLSKLMDIPLEDGDQFTVPARPATVNVLGAVYNQSSFLYRPGMRIADYMREAGGPKREADKGRIFVIRADGSVVPKQGFNPFTKSFEAEKLNAGDSIVVPQAIFRTGFMRGLRDWSQVLSGFGLAAGAVNVLR
ncbi:MAG TPA: SLBB domain-containing protein [Bryobacteraceae bacterium]